MLCKVKSFYQMEWSITLILFDVTQLNCDKFESDLPIAVTRALEKLKHPTKRRPEVVVFW